MLIIFHEPHNLKFWLTLISIGLLGYLAEVLGTNTGLIFGQYSYVKSLGPGLFNTPFNMAVNWVMLIYLVAYIFQPLKISLTLKSGVSALVLTAFDWIIEPVAIRLDMWHWKTASPPLQNFVGWFVISFILFEIFYYFVIKFKNPLAGVFAMMYGIFFTGLNLIFRVI